MRCVFLLFFLLSAAAARSTSRGTNYKQPRLTIKIIHANDVHAHIEQSSISLSRCRSEDEELQQCVGGAPRMYTKIKELVDLDPDHTLVLNAGDYFQGTIWYTLFKYRPIVEFSNIMNYTAMALGNHEFDDSMAGLEPFIKGAEFPLLAANIDGSNWTNWDQLVKKSIVKEIDGIKVGIIGYVTRDTSYISKPDTELVFLDVIESVSKEARRLKEEEGVNILIALGHAGYGLDQKMASEVPELDLIVGGHSHTFLYTGKPPSIENPEGPYPTYVKQNGFERVIPVVQAYCYSKYLGYLEVNFGHDGELIRPVEGKGVSKADVILLDEQVMQDGAVLKAMEKYRNEMTYFTKVLGTSLVNLTASRKAECSMGNLIADSMLDAWGGRAQMAFINSGGIRTGLQAGSITGEDIFSVIPFNNTIDMVTINGSDIRKVLENFASGFKCGDGGCVVRTFLQVAGVKIEYHITKDNVGSRVRRLRTRCPRSHSQNQEQQIQFPLFDEHEKRDHRHLGAKWCPVEDSRNYNVALISFLTKGGSRTCNFNCFFTDLKVGPRDYVAVIDYVGKHNPIKTTVEGRVTVTYDSSALSDPTPSSRDLPFSCPKQQDRISDQI